MLGCPTQPRRNEVADPHCTAPSRPCCRL